MCKRYRDLMLVSIAQRIRVEFDAPSALTVPFVVALENLNEDEKRRRGQAVDDATSQKPGRRIGTK